MSKREALRRCNELNRSNFSCSEMEAMRRAEFRGARSQRERQAEIVREYGSWLEEKRKKGWDVYLFSINFQPLPGGRQAKLDQMYGEIIGLYAKLCTRVVRKPRSPKWAQWLPVGIFLPDLPVHKKKKAKIQDLVINDGLHFHGLMACHRFGRLSESLVDHFTTNSNLYLTDRIREIDVVEIDAGLRFKVTDYALKGLTNQKFGGEDLLILPASLSELFSRKRW